MQFAHDAVEVFDLHPDQGWADKIADRTFDRTQRIAGDDGGGRRFAVTDPAIIRHNPHDNILHRFHGAQRGFERVAQRQRDAPDLNILNQHGKPFLVPRASADIPFPPGKAQKIKLNKFYHIFCCL